MILQILFVQGIASPQVEYTLCSLAVRLAQQKGLHRRHQQGWNLESEEINARNRMFWILYWLDKTISLRSGRASVSGFHFPIPWLLPTPESNAYSMLLIFDLLYFGIGKGIANVMKGHR